jgi:isochorismate synthase EntC
MLVLDLTDEACVQQSRDLRFGCYNFFHLTSCEAFVFEGPEKVTRGGVNGSQSKFLAGTWPISQNQPDTPLF